MQVRKIESQERYRKKRVAAYARVSTMRECQEESFATQVKYYETLIKSTENWKFAKVYADYGFSGVSAQNRPGFMEMMRDAERDEFDILIVRSISRFARNAKEAQIYCRELKLRGIEVRFEKEGVSGNDSTAEMAFNLLASCAQEESRAISERTKWGIYKRQEQGIYHVGNGRIFGYDEIKGELIPNEDAWVISYIFVHYAAGLSISQICEALSDMGHNTTRASVGRMLRNDVYVGDRVLQKQAPKNYLTHKPDKKQAYQSYYVKNTHKGIVSRELWNNVRRRIEYVDELASMGVKVRRDSHFLYGKVFCGLCGHPLKRKWVMSGGVKTAVWKCSDRLKGKNGHGCKNTIWKEDEFLKAVCNWLKTEAAEPEWAVGFINRIIVTGDAIEVSFLQIT